MSQLQNIMLIDDDNIFNFINKKIIEYGNFSQNVTSYVNADKALDDLRKFSDSGEDFPDTIFLDINMPVMDGWEFLEEFEKFPDTILNKCSVYMLSSSIDPCDIEKSKTYKSVKNFFSKPLTDEILETLSSTVSSFA